VVDVESGWMSAVSSGKKREKSGRTRISVTRPPPEGRMPWLKARGRS